ncbi:Pathogen effector [Microdochium nivale]|nr:Pathogen effector [Microdochium nivale]
MPTSSALLIDEPLDFKQLHHTHQSPTKPLKPTTTTTTTPSARRWHVEPADFPQSFCAASNYTGYAPAAPLDDCAPVLRAAGFPYAYYDLAPADDLVAAHRHGECGLWLALVRPLGGAVRIGNMDLAGVVAESVRSWTAPGGFVGVQGQMRCYWDRGDEIDGDGGWVHWHFGRVPQTTSTGQAEYLE